MLENFLVAVNAVMPIFLLIVVGMLASKKHYMSDKELDHANKAVFQVMFPIMMFYNIFSSDFSGMIIPSYIAFCVIFVFIVLAVSVVIAFAIEKDYRSRGALIQAIYRSNFVLMGIPIMRNLMGEESVGLTSFMTAIIIPIFNMIAVILFEVMRGGNLKPMQMIKKILTNPLIMGAIAGLLAVAVGLKLPPLLEKPISQITAASSPVALMILGATFKFNTLKDNLVNLIVGVLGKLFLAPAIALFPAYFLGMRGLPMAILIVMFGSPCAVSGYTMAQQMDSNADLAASCLIFTSLFSCISITFWIFLFKQMGAF